MHVKNKYCLNSHKKSLLDRITFMVDPVELMEAGIPVYKAYQRPHDYICTFFSAYHCGFSQGYNVGEAVNFLSPLSIEVMKKAEKEKDDILEKDMQRNDLVNQIRSMDKSQLEILANDRWGQKLHNRLSLENARAKVLQFVDQYGAA